MPSIVDGWIFVVGKHHLLIHSLWVSHSIT